MLSIEHYFFLSFALFLLGVVGVVTRKNPLVVLMSTELILNAVNINLVAFSRLFGDGSGQAVAILLLIVGLCEVAVGVAIVVAIFRDRGANSADAKGTPSW